MSFRHAIGGALLAVLVLTSGCAGEEPVAEVPKVVKRAYAVLDGKSGSEMYGKAIFINEPDGVALLITIENAAPGSHAVHLHETGDCSADDGTSAGGHWNPAGHQHGKWGEDGHHLGDIGNLEIGADGTGTLEFKTDRWQMGGGVENDIMGKAMIIHADPDDFETQPTGAAGGRIGCGVVES